MNKQTASFVIVLVILIVGGFLYFSTDTFKKDSGYNTDVGKLTNTPSFSLPNLTPPNLEILPNKDTAVINQAWATWEKYIEFAKAHNLAGIRSLSHQISKTCNDPSKEKECFELMDSVVNFSTLLKREMFNHTQTDDKQIMMWSEGPGVVILFFTKDQSGAPKVLGLRFCQEDEKSETRCVETDPDKRDLDGNGWWDSTESLFYPDA